MIARNMFAGIASLCLSMIVNAGEELAAPGLPIAFQGIDWWMTEAEMMAELESQGYLCQRVGDDLLGPYPSCHKGSARVDILVKFGVVEFNCASHDGCNQTQDKIVKRIISSGLVDVMDVNSSDYYNQALYCGDGVLGDAICVDSTGSVFLYRARLETQEVSLGSE